jgi:hypothetical protein
MNFCHGVKSSNSVDRVLLFCLEEIASSGAIWTGYILIKRGEMWGVCISTPGGVGIRVSSNSLLWNPNDGLYDQLTWCITFKSSLEFMNLSLLSNLFLGHLGSTVLDY